MSQKTVLLGAAGTILAIATGCGSGLSGIAPVADENSIRGQILGGHQPVSNASLQLYAVGTTGGGSAATPLFATPEKSDAGGYFSFAPYTCPSPDTPVYLVATGGDPGVGSQNPSLAMMSAVGPCSTLGTTSPLVINEVTTVAGVWALAPFMASATAIGSSAADAANLSQAFSTARMLANLNTGTSPGTNVPPGYLVPESTVNTVADVLSACVNSNGGKAGDSDPCGTLFAFAQANSGKPANDTLDAALAVAEHPNSEVSNIFAILPSNAPFQPQLTAAPSAWTISLVAYAPPPTFASSPSESGLSVSLADSTAAANIYYTLDGSQPSASSTLYTGAITLSKTTKVNALAVVNSTVSTVSSQTFTVAPVPSQLVFLSQPQAGVAGSLLSPAVTIGVQDQYGNPVLTTTNAVSLTLASGSGEGSLTGPSLVTPSNGVATFSGLSISSAGSYSLVAAYGSLPVVTSLPVTITPPAARLPLVTAKPAAGFVDSVGIDVHFNYYGSIYTNNTPLMISSLQALHITHLRDAMCWQGPQTWNTFYILHQQLGALGFKTDYIPAIDQRAEEFAAYPGLVPDMEAVEPSNEYDISGDPQWAATIKAQAAALFETYHTSFPSITVLAPSLAYPTNASALGDVSSTSDAGNLHGYFGGFNPGSATINPSIYLSEIKSNTPNEPIWVTETGYFAQPGPINGTYGLSPAAQAAYSTRSLLEWSNAGAARTYLYELADDEIPGEDPSQYHWGLLNADGSPKPSFYAVSNLLTVLSDPAGLAGFTAQPLAMALVGGDSNVHTALFQKANGSYYLAVWVEASSYDFIKQVPTTVPAQNVTLQLGSKVASASTTQWDDAGNVAITTLTASQNLNLTVSDKVQIVQIVLQ